jgi:hypothetical protein
VTRPGSTRSAEIATSRQPTARRACSTMLTQPASRETHGWATRRGQETPNRANGPVPSTSDAQGGSARGLPGISGITCGLHPPMNDSHTGGISSRGLSAQQAARPPRARRRGGCRGSRAGRGVVWDHAIALLEQVPHDPVARTPRLRRGSDERDRACAREDFLRAPSASRLSMRPMADRLSVAIQALRYVGGTSRVLPIVGISC